MGGGRETVAPPHAPLPMISSSTTKYHPLAWLASRLSVSPTLVPPSTVLYMSEGQFSPSMSMYVCSMALGKSFQLGSMGSYRRGTVKVECSPRALQSSSSASVGRKAQSRPATTKLPTQAALLPTAASLQMYCMPAKDCRPMTAKMYMKSSTSTRELPSAGSIKYSVSVMLARAVVRKKRRPRRARRALTARMARRGAAEALAPCCPPPTAAPATLVTATTQSTAFQRLRR